MYSIRHKSFLLRQKLPFPALDSADVTFITYLILYEMFDEESHPDSESKYTRYHDDDYQK